MSFADLIAQNADTLPRWLSHMVFGAVGGLLYILRQHVRKYNVNKWEYAARPIFGAIAAWTLTVALGLPNHLTSLFVGYFGIDVWDAVSSRFEKELPLAAEHVPRDELEAAIVRRVDVLEATPSETPPSSVSHLPSLEERRNE